MKKKGDSGQARMTTKREEGSVWNLDDVLKVEDFDEFYRKLEKELERVEEYVDKLDPEMSAADFKKMIEFEEELGDRAIRLGSLAFLMEAVDQKNSKAKLMKSRVQELGLKIAEKTRIIGHWIKGLPAKELKILNDKNAKRLFKSVPDLEYGLNYSREAAKYSLTLKEEGIVDNKDANGIGQLTSLRELIETEFEYEFKGKKIKTQAELMKHVYSEKANEREAAYRSLLTKLKENIDKLFLIYQAVVKDWVYEAKLRGYKSPISVQNFDNHVTDKTVEVLLETCTKNKEIFQRFFKYKAKEMGVKKIKRFDLYAPVSLHQKRTEIEFLEAKRMVLDTFGDFSPKFKNLAEKILEEKHIDSHPRINKISGGFCATVSPKVTPFILLNYTNKIRDVEALAHELGHGIHSLYANKHHPSAQLASLPLAETASTLAEMMLFEKLYREEKDKKIRKTMLYEKMANSYASILRQNYFVIFEKRAHEAIPKGITAEQLSELWMETLKEQFGDSVEIDPIFKYEWTYISHIYQTPFYCYAYNFGELLSYSLYARYKQEGKKFVPKIEKILETGGSKNPNEILKEVGVDMESEKFWQDSFEIIKEWEKELERV